MTGARAKRSTKPSSENYECWTWLGRPSTAAFSATGRRIACNKSGFLGLSEDLPEPISLIDTEKKIRRALAALREMVREGLVAMTDMEVLHHTSAEGKK